MSNPMVANSLPNSKPKDRIMHMVIERFEGGISRLTQVNLQSDASLLFTALSTSREDGPTSIPVVPTIPELARILVKACVALNRATYVELADAETRLQEEV